MISAATLNSELINKIAQDFAQARPALRLSWSIFTAMKFPSCLTSLHFVR